MAVDEFDVSSLTADAFKKLLQTSLRDVKTIKLTLRKDSEKKYEQFPINVGSLQGASQMKPEDLPLALLFCKNQSDALPEGLNLENYDIIAKVSNQVKI